MGSLRPLVLTLLLVAAAAGAADDDVVINLFAEEQRWEGDVWRGLGGVKILYQDITVQCDEMEYDRATMDLVARGNVVFDQGPSRFTADELRFNLGSKTGIFINGSGFIPPFYTFAGREIEKIDDTRYRIDGATFTTCEVVEGRHPPWSFRIKRALLEEEAYGRFKSVAFRGRNVPVFYLPYVVWPIKRERSPGVLMPTFGYSQRRGFNLALPVYFPIGRSYDTTIIANYFSEGTYGIGNEWRWAPSVNAAGLSQAVAVRDHETGLWQWKVFANHLQQDFLGFNLRIDVDSLSDPDFWQEFERALDANTRRQSYSQAFMTRTRGAYTLNLRIDHRTAFVEPNDSVTLQIPEVEFRVRANRIGRTNLFWNMVSSVNVFDVDRGPEYRGTYGRADAFPELSYTLPSPVWLSVTPTVGARGTFYSASQTDTGQLVNEASERVNYGGGVDVVGPSISRIFNSGSGTKYKHLVEPRIQYVYLQGTSDTSDLPRTVDDVDSALGLFNRVTMVLSNRLYGRSEGAVSARELATFALSQTYSFDEPLNQSSGESSQWGPLRGTLRLTPVPTTTIDLQADFDTLFKNLTSTSLAANQISPFGSFGLRWSQNNNAVTGERTRSQMQANLRFAKPGFPLDAAVSLWYDLEEKNFPQQRYQVHWQGSCWGISAEYRDLQNAVRPTRDYLITIELKGVGRLPEIKGRIGGGGL